MPPHSHGDDQLILHREPVLRALLASLGLLPSSGDVMMYSGGMGTRSPGFKISRSWSASCQNCMNWKLSSLRSSEMTALISERSYGWDSDTRQIFNILSSSTRGHNCACW